MLENKHMTIKIVKKSCLFGKQHELIKDDTQKKRQKLRWLNG